MADQPDPRLESLRQAVLDLLGKGLPPALSA